MLPQRGTGPFLSMGPVPLGTRPMQGFILLIKFMYLKEKRKKEGKNPCQPLPPTKSYIKLPVIQVTPMNPLIVFKWFPWCIYSKV